MGGLAAVTAALVDRSASAAILAFKEFESSERSGHRIRQRGFFAPGFCSMAGRATDTTPRKGEEVHRLRSAFNLPATPPVRVKATRRGFIELTQESPMHHSHLSSVSPVVSLLDGQPVTSSVEVARIFGKQHDDVLRRIRATISDLPPDCLHNFAETVVTRPSPLNGAPIESPAYNLTRDGFTLIAMGFTGKRALAFKLVYIDAFNKMEAALRTPASAERLTQCWKVANALSGIAQQALFDHLAAGDSIDCERFLVALQHDGHPSVQRIESGALIGTVAALTKMVTDPGGFPLTDGELANLAKACTDRLAARIQRRTSNSNGADF